MLTINDLKIGTYFIYKNEPYEVLKARHLKMQQRKPVVQTRIKNLITGRVLEQNFHPNEKFEEAEINKIEIKYLYNHRDEYWFHYKNDPSKRFNLKKNQLSGQEKFLKPNLIIDALEFNDKIINILLPSKINLKVIETPPGIKGDTATGGTKMAILETGAKINVPLFINTGDIIRVNTKTGEYVEKAKE